MTHPQDSLVERLREALTDALGYFNHRVDHARPTTNSPEKPPAQET